MSPTSLTLDLLRRSGYLAAVVERWLPKINKRRDLFGIIDVLGIHPVRREVLLVQTTTIANLSARLAKVKASPVLPGLLAAGVVVQLHGSRKNAGKGWRPKIITVRAEDLQAVVVVPLPRRPRRCHQGTLFE